MCKVTAKHTPARTVLIRVRACLLLNWFLIYFLPIGQKILFCCAAHLATESCVLLRPCGHILCACFETGKSSVFQAILKNMRLDEGHMRVGGKCSYVPQTPWVQVRLGLQGWWVQELVRVGRQALQIGRQVMVRAVVRAG